jgi:hypothetical protein
MREKVNVLYYPEFWMDYTTLIKAILLFDEIHIMDRPSIMFGGTRGQFGTIGAASPLRQYEASFREEGVPLYVHSAPMGPVGGEWYDQITADVNDPEFLRRFQGGLKTSSRFRTLQIAPGDYGENADQDAVARRLIDVDTSTDFKSHESAMALFDDASIHPFQLSTAVGCAKQLVADAVICSAKLNFALTIWATQGFLPLADARPYADLLGTKYARAISKLEPAVNKIQVTDLSFAIFDELIPAGNLRKLKVADAIAYRKQSAAAREAFLEHLTLIQSKHTQIGPDGDYAATVQNLVAAEVMPAVRTFRNKLQTIDEGLFGAVAKGVVGAIGSSSAVTLFADLSWQKIIGLAGVAAAYVANASIDAILAERAAKRECSISYVLSLD